MERALPTSEGGTPYECTVPSLHPCHTARFQAPPRLHPHPFHSYWPLLLHTVDPPGTGRAKGEKIYVMHIDFISTQNQITNALQSETVFLTLFPFPQGSMFLHIMGT